MAGRIQIHDTRLSRPRFVSLEKTISRATKAGLRDIKPISQDGMYGSSIVEWMKINIELISHDGMQWSSIVEWMKRNVPTLKTILFVFPTCRGGIVHESWR